MRDDANEFMDASRQAKRLANGFESCSGLLRPELRPVAGWVARFRVGDFRLTMRAEGSPPRWVVENPPAKWMS